MIEAFLEPVFHLVNADVVAGQVGDQVGKALAAVVTVVQPQQEPDAVITAGHVLPNIRSSGRDTAYMTP